MMTVFTLLIVLLGFVEDGCTLYVHVNAPYWAIEKKIDLEVVESSSEEKHSLGGLPAGLPGIFQLYPGNYHLRASGEGLATVFTGPIHIAPQTDYKKVTINLQKGATVSGVVREPSGTPLSGARVALGRHSTSRHDTADPFLPDLIWSSKKRAPHSLVAVTSENGVFMIRDVPLEFDDLVIEGSGCQLYSERLSLTPGAFIEKEWTLKRGAPSINIRVLDQNGKSIQKAWACWLDPVCKLFVDQNLEPIYMPWYAGPSSAKGRIEIIDPPLGPFDLWVRAEGHRWKEVQVAPGEGFDVVLDPASSRLEIVAVDIADSSLINGIEVVTSGITFLKPPLASRRIDDGRVMLEGDMESFPVFAAIHASGYRSVTTRYLWFGDGLRSDFDRFPLHDGTLYGQEKEKFKDLNIEKGIEEGKLFVNMEKAPERMEFRLHVLGKRGIPLDGLEIICDYIVQDGRCFSPGGKNLVINQLTPETAEVIISVRGDGKLVDVRYLSAPFYEPHPRITFTADINGMTREIRLKPRKME